MKRSIACAIVIFLSCVGIGQSQSEGLIVHEWGTFTSLHDEMGRALPGIDQSVEPLPSFVKSMMLDNGKGLSPIMTPGITMRLETPVVYFHLPAGASPIKIDSFSATFHGGLLSQWYPDATNSSPVARASAIDPKTENSLSWNNISVGNPGKLAETDSHVWLAPRQVNAADVTVKGQTERYLFYRGVGVLDGPVRVERDGDQVHVVGRVGYAFATPEQMRIDDIWYFDVRPDGSCAFRKLESTGLADLVKPLATTRADFDDSEYHNDGATTMRSQMKHALVRSGLYDDEAAAMLSTWEDTYFKSVGTRVFYIVPHAWTDHFLPIKLSTSATIDRVMVGRIDLVTPRQRDLAREIIKTTAPNAAMPMRLVKEMGRFATAIVANERARMAPTATAR